MAEVKEDREKIRKDDRGKVKIAEKEMKGESKNGEE